MAAVIIVLASAGAASHLRMLRAFSDYLSVTYPAGSVKWEQFETFLKSGYGQKFACAAVWRDRGERTLRKESSGKNARVKVYEIGGQMQAVFGNTLLCGRYPEPDEEGVCLIDRGTAEELLGSKDVLGLEITLDGENCRIAGILDGTRRVCVLPASEGTFEGVTVRKHEPEQSSENVQAVLDAHFGGSSIQITDGQLCYLATLVKLSFFFLSASVLPGVILIKVRGKYLAGGTALAAGIFILVLIGRGMPVGSDYLPTYWADLDFFADLWQEKNAQLETLAGHQEFWHEERMISNHGFQVLGFDVTIDITTKPC